VAALAYLNSLGHGFTWDDAYTIQGSRFTRSLRNVATMVSPRYFDGAEELTYRPLVTLSYFFDYALHRLQPRGYHLTSLALHALASAAACLLLAQLLANRQAGVIGGLLFAVHPVQTEAVCAISFREDVLCAGFMFVAIWLVLRGRRATGRGRAVRRVGAALALAAALLSKEMAVMAVFLIILWDAFVGEDASLSVPWRHRADYAVLLVPVAGYLALRFSVLHNPQEATVWQPAAIGRAPALLWGYLRLTFFPLLLTARYPRVPAPQEFAPVLAWLSLGIAAALVWASRRTRRTLACLVWLAAALVPVLNLVRISISKGERYLYGPLLAFPLLLFAASRRSGKARAAAVLCLTATAPLVALSMERSYAWTSDLTLWAEASKTAPGQTWIRESLAIAYSKAARLKPAARECEWVLARLPDSRKMRRLRGELYRAEQDFSAALKECRAATELSPEDADAWVSLARVQVKLGRIDDARDALTRALALDAANSAAHNYLGVLAERSGDLRAARRYYQQAITLDPDSAQAHFHLGNVLSTLRQHESAIRAYERAVRLRPGFAQAHNNLAGAYLETGRLDACVSAYEQALRFKPDLWRADYALAMIAEARGDLDEARSRLERVLRHKPGSREARDRLQALQAKEAERRN